MKKLSTLIFHSEYKEFLYNLQNLGVVHVQVSDDVQCNDSDVKSEELMLQHYQHVMEQLKSIEIGKNQNLEKIVFTNIVDKVDEINDLIQKKNQLKQRLSSEVSILEPWGAFNCDDIQCLHDAGYSINYFSCFNKSFSKKWEEEYNALVISEINGTVYFITITPNGLDMQLDAQHIILPDSELAETKSKLDVLNLELIKLQNQLAYIANNGIDDLNKSILQLEQKIVFDKIVLKTESAAEDRLMLLEGWFPVICEEKVISFLEKSEIYFETREPSADDNVPILLKNNSWTRMYEVLTRMYGSPNYNEFDPTPIVAPFFTLFFAICMGDSGYGILLMIIGALIAADKLKIEMFKGLGPLIISLGVATFVVGFFLGTFFGIDLSTASWMPESTKNLFLKGTVAGYDIQMVMAIIIGILHLCLAMIVKCVVYTRNQGFSQTISAWGWLILYLGSIVTGVLYMCNTLNQEMTKIVFIAIGVVSALAIFIFNNPKRNPLINIGAGIWDTYGMVTGLGGDILSYIRLYALGLAGGMLGSAFNSLGDMVLGPDPSAFSWVGVILIYLIGHLLNLAMSALGAFVHPLRLTFVEYFKNSGYEGSGVEYKPFKKLVE